MNKITTTHTFNIYIAKELGINASIILTNMLFWLEKNEANQSNYHEEKYWTYNSIKAYGEIFPYLSERQIRYTLDKLEEDGIVLTGNFNKANFDKTKWYTVSDKGYELIQSVQPVYTKCIKELDNVYNAIPDVNTDVNKHISTIVKDEPKERIPYKEVIDYLNLKANKNYDFKTRSYRTKIKKLWEQDYTLENFKHVIDVKTEQWFNEEWQFRGNTIKGNNLLNPHKLFGDDFNKFVNDERVVTKKEEVSYKYKTVDDIDLKEVGEVDF